MANSSEPLNHNQPSLNNVNGSGTDLSPLQRRGQSDPCAFARRGGDGQFAADQFGPLVHVDHAQATALVVPGLYGIYVESETIVLYLDDECVVLATQSYPDVVRFGVFAGVADGLGSKVGKNGHFLGCSGYPQCTYTRNYTRDEKGKIQPVEPSADELTEKSCEKCGRPMVVKHGKYGTFLACSGYPDCKHTQSLYANNAEQDTGVNCPQTDCDGRLVQRQSKRGKIFYGCSRFPDCNFATWDKPVAKNCPLCGAVFVVEKSTKKQGTFITCHTKGCKFKEKT